MNPILQILSFSLLLLVTNRLVFLNRNYSKVFINEYEWEDLWSNNIKNLKAVEMIFHSLVFMCLWFICKDTCFGFIASSIVFIVFIVAMAIASMFFVYMLGFRPKQDPEYYYEPDSDEGVFVYFFESGQKLMATVKRYYNPKIFIISLVVIFATALMMCWRFVDYIQWVFQ